MLTSCFLCGSNSAALVADIRTKPARETDFGVSGNYSRQVYQCRACSVYYNVQQMLDAGIYTDAYNLATYQRNLAETYDRIWNLPEDRSDNKQRVKRVIEFNERAGRFLSQTSVLDVGSGICVFLGEMKERGFYCYSIDPAELSTRHAIEHAKVDGAHAGTLDDFQTDQRFDIIAFNKVLEHVPDPIRVLSRAKQFLSERGFIYVELPDAAGALENGDAIQREEFYIEHFTIFTLRSLNYLAEASGLRVVESRSIHEPSDKYTLYAFLDQETR